MSSFGEKKVEVIKVVRAPDRSGLEGSQGFSGRRALMIKGRHSQRPKPGISRKAGEAGAKVDIK